MTKIWRKTALS